MSGILGSIGGNAISGLLLVLGPLVIGWISGFLTDILKRFVTVIDQQGEKTKTVINAAIASLVAAIITATGLQLCPDTMQSCGLGDIQVNVAAAAIFGALRKHAQQIQRLKAG